MLDFYFIVGKILALKKINAIFLLCCGEILGLKMEFCFYVKLMLHFYFVVGKSLALITDFFFCKINAIFLHFVVGKKLVLEMEFYFVILMLYLYFDFGKI